MAARAGERREATRGGVAAGVVGGVALYLSLMLVTAAAGGDLWSVLKGASAPFFGQRVAQPGFDAVPILVGILCHFIISIGWGVLFGLWAFGMRRGPTLVAGALFGVVVWFGMYVAVLPLVGLGDMARTTPAAFAIFLHVVFGFFLAVGFLPYQRPRPPLMPRVQGSMRGGRNLEDHYPPGP